MTTVVYSITEDSIPEGNQGSTVIAAYTFSNNNEPDLPGARIHAIAPEHTKIITMMYYEPSILTISDDGKTADIVAGNSTDPWHTERSITLLIDSDAPIGSTLTGELQYFDTDNVAGPKGDISVKVTADVVPIITSFELEGSWQDWESQGWIYSYRIYLQASSESIKNWAVFFDQLPPGSSIYNQSTLWAKVVMDGSGGVVELQTPDDGSYLIQPDTQLPIDIQILYPSASGKLEAFEQLYDLIGVDLD